MLSKANLSKMSTNAIEAEFEKHLSDSIVGTFGFQRVNKLPDAKHRPEDYKIMALWGSATGSMRKYIQDEQFRAAIANAPLDTIYIRGTESEPEFHSARTISTCAKRYPAIYAELLSMGLTLDYTGDVRTEAKSRFGEVLSCDISNTGAFILRIKRDVPGREATAWMTIRAFISSDHSVSFEYGHYDLTEAGSIESFDKRMGGDEAIELPTVNAEELAARASVKDQIAYEHPETVNPACIAYYVTVSGMLWDGSDGELELTFERFAPTLAGMNNLTGDFESISDVQVVKSTTTYEDVVLSFVTAIRKYRP